MPEEIISGAWTDRSLGTHQRAEAAVAAMTLDEKLSILSTPMTIALRENAPAGVPLSIGHIPAVARLGLQAVAETDGPIGVSNIGNIRAGDTATALPAALALGASFDPELARRGGAMIGGEARAKGFGILLAGGANLVRDPRGGRAFEYISEDPLLTGVITGAIIEGVQSARVVSTLKHLALNDLETGRNVYDVEMPEATMRETDLLAFEIAHERGRPGSVMGAYNRVNGEWASDSAFLMSDVLRRDWNFEGFTMTDWGSLHSVEALEAGMDQQSGWQVDTQHFYGPVLREAVAAGQVPISAVDRAATRILRTLFDHGVYDEPPQPGSPIDLDANGAVAQAQAEAGIVLLRNRDKILPLAATAGRIAVIGGHADVGVLAGGGSSQVAPVGGNKLEIAPGGEGILSFAKRVYGGTAPVDAIRSRFPQATVEFASGEDRDAAIALARHADLVLIFAEKWSTEAIDTPDLDLEGDQDQLIEDVARANPRTIVVLETCNALAMPWREHVAAILLAWFPGQNGAQAITRILAGDVNPSGRLPMTFPVDVNQLPHPNLPGSDVPAPPPGSASNFGVLADKVPFAYSFPEGVDVGYRWYQRTGAEPLYPFGFGLSYTSFAYADLVASTKARLSVTFVVSNIGLWAGVDTPQIYVTPPGRTKRLVGWGRPQLAPGEARSLTIEVDPRLLADFDEQSRTWVIRAGEYRIELGASATSTATATKVQVADTRIPADADFPLARCFAG